MPGLNVGTAGFLRTPIVEKDGKVSRDFLKYLNNIEQFLTTLFAVKVAQLPVNPIPQSGSIAYATNGRKQGEGPGAGTGVPVYFSNGAWRRYSDDAAVQA